MYTYIHAPRGPTPSPKIVQEFHKILYRVVQLCVHQKKPSMAAVQRKNREGRESGK